MSETSVTAGRDGLRGAAEGPATQDGRLSRAARTRAAVVEALLALNEQGSLRPTARDIATEAGVSLRSLYVHFDDLEALMVAAAERHTAHLAEILGPFEAEGDTHQRVETLVARRVTLHEVGAGVRRAALHQEPFSPALQQALGQGRKSLRAEVRQAFAPEIEAAPAGTGVQLARALDIALSGPTWESLRVHQNLPVDEATDQVRAMVLAFLHAWGPPDQDERLTGR